MGFQNALTRNDFLGLSWNRNPHVDGSAIMLVDWCETANCLEVSGLDFRKKRKDHVAYSKW